MESFTELRNEYRRLGKAIIEVGPSDVGTHIPDVMLRMSHILDRFNKLCSRLNVCYICKQPLDADHSIMSDGTKVCTQCVSVPA